MIPASASAHPDQDTISGTLALDLILSGLKRHWEHKEVPQNEFEYAASENTMDTLHLQTSSSSSTSSGLKAVGFITDSRLKH